MLKELLPKLKEKLKKQKDQHPENNNSKKDDSETKSLSPNLLTPMDIKQSELKYSRPKLVRLTAFIVYLVSTILLALLGFNYYLDNTLNEKASERDRLISEINAQSNIEQEVKDINTLLEIYKENGMSDEELAPIFKNVLEISSRATRIENFLYSNDKSSFTIFSNAKSPQQYAYLIENLLSFEEVQDITINKVELLGRVDQEYSAVIDVKIK